MGYPLWLHQFWQKILSLTSRSAPVLYRGIDVSGHNGSVDFKALRRNIDFAILRCGYGGNYTHQDDSCFTHNVWRCTEAGIPYGVYLYSYAENKSMARDEAAHVLRLLHGIDPDFGVWYDVEDKCLPFSAGLVPSLCKTWCDIMLAAGCTCVGIYASLYDMRRYLSVPMLEPYEKWVAHWDGSCGYPKAGIWQFTDHATLKGQGPFDMSYAYKDYLDITGGNMTPQKFSQMMESYLADLAQRPVSSWAKPAWDSACAQGLFDRSRPRDFLTREEAAVVLERINKSKQA